MNNASDDTRDRDYNIDKFLYCPKMKQFYKGKQMFFETSFVVL